MMTDEDRQVLSDLRVKLPIDQFELEVENCKQPVLYDEVGQWVSGIKAACKTAKEHIEYIKADLSLKIRMNPKDYGLEEKPKEGAISAAITTSEEYQQTIKDYIEADKLANEASILLSSVEQRKSLIGNLVQLFVRAYYYNDKPVNTEEWKSAQDAIISMRNERAAEKEDVDEDRVEEI